MARHSAVVLPLPGRPRSTRTGLRSVSNDACCLFCGRPAMSWSMSVACRTRQGSLPACPPPSAAWSSWCRTARTTIVPGSAPAPVRRPAAPGYPPPQVVLAAAGAAERRAPPAAVRPRAPLDDRGASVGSQLLEDQPEPPVQVGPLPQRVRHARVEPYRLRQRARLVGLLRRDVSAEAVGLVRGSRPGPACAAVPASVGPLQLVLVVHHPLGQHPRQRLARRAG